MKSSCKACLIPISVPGVSLDQEGTCNHCTANRDERAESLRRKENLANLEETLSACRGVGPYDVLVNLSGGKDSTLLLYKLKHEYGLRPLAFTTDMHVPEIAWQNIRRTVKALDVPHVTFRPPEDFYKKLFRHLLTQQEERGAVRTVCYVCAPLFEGFALKHATDAGIPLVVAGYSPGQPDPSRMHYEFSPRLLREFDWTPRAIKESGLLSPDELQMFWNPLSYPSDVAIPRYLAPFHAWDYSQEEAMSLVVKLGLIASRRNANPIHSNCPINWLLMYSDLKHLGYNPYQPEFSALIREGKASRAYWRIAAPIVNGMIRTKTLLGREVKRSLDWVGLNESDVQITQPEGTYDPSSDDVTPAMPSHEAAAPPFELASHG